MNVVVYKAVFRPAGDDGYDRLYPPECPPEPGVRYVLFRDTDRPSAEHGWEVLPQRFDDRDMRRRARHHKCLPHLLFPDADFTLWLDGSLTPKVSPLEVAAKWGAEHVATFDRKKRTCLYDEAAAMAKKRRDDPRTIAEQVERYRRAGMPRRHGLCATTAVLRRNTPLAAEFGERWWRELCAGSNRDQISANFVLWQMGLAWGRLPGDWNRSPLFTWRRHYETENPRPE